MASTNFLIFDEGKQNMMSDGDYNANTQRARGVTPGIAYPNLHNKLYYQTSVMVKAIADFIVSQGANANDEDVEQLTADISTAFTNFVDNQILETLNAENVGNVIYRPFLQDGYVKLNGATVQRADYPRLVKYATTNNLWTDTPTTEIWLFGNGDGETTFVLPDYRNVFIEGGDTPAKIEAGLPNITGKTPNGTQYIHDVNVTDPNSAIYKDNINHGYSENVENTNGDALIFDASRCNKIYGNSETVQPPAIVLIPQIKY